MFDFVIVGSGMFGSVFAHEMTKSGKKCLVLEKRNHIGGNCYTENVDGINIHKYGAHIFHTNDKSVWDYLNNLVPFNRYTNSPMANYKGELFNLPFNMNTFYQLWGVTTPAQARAKIDEQTREYKHFVQPKNLEEQALSLAGKDIYEKLIKGYTEKQWGRPATEIPSFIIKRLPFRYTFDNNYFNDFFQGIPIGGYTKIFDELLVGCEVRLGVDFLSDKEQLEKLGAHIIYTGPIDRFFNFQFGALEYRSLEFETVRINEANYQGNAVVNYTDSNVPFTRIIEHKHFEFGNQDFSIITKEYSRNWTVGDEPFYPINDQINTEKYENYSKLAAKELNYSFGGRLATYRYLDMHQVVKEAIELSKKFLNN